MNTLTLKGGTVVHVAGLPVYLCGDTEIETESTHQDLSDFTTTQFQEYPKDIGGGKVVGSAAEEAEWRNPTNTTDPVTPAKVTPAKAAKTSALDDVTIEMDHPTFAASEKPAERYDIDADKTTRRDSHKKK